MYFDSFPAKPDVLPRRMVHALQCSMLTLSSDVKARIVCRIVCRMPKQNNDVFSMGAPIAGFARNAFFHADCQIPGMPQHHIEGNCDYWQ